MAGLVLAFIVKSGALTVWEPTDGKKGGRGVKRKWRRHDVEKTTEQEKKTFLASQIMHTTVTSELSRFMTSYFKIAISPGGDLEWW